MDNHRVRELGTEICEENSLNGRINLSPIFFLLLCVCVCVQSVMRHCELTAATVWSKKWNIQTANRVTRALVKWNYGSIPSHHRPFIAKCIKQNTYKHVSTTKKAIREKCNHSSN